MMLTETHPIQSFIEHEESWEDVEFPTSGLMPLEKLSVTTREPFPALSEEEDNYEEDSFESDCSTLISHKVHKKTPPTNGNMTFDPVGKQWLKMKNTPDDDDEESESSDDEDWPMDVSNTEEEGQFNVGSEFDITPGLEAMLVAAERQHGTDMTRWYPTPRIPKNEERFGLKNMTALKGHLYEIRKVASRSSACRSSRRPPRRSCRPSNNSRRWR